MNILKAKIKSVYDWISEPDPSIIDEKIRRDIKLQNKAVISLNILLLASSLSYRLMPFGLKQSPSTFVFLCLIIGLGSLAMRSKTFSWIAKSLFLITNFSLTLVLNHFNPSNIFPLTGIIILSPGVVFILTRNKFMVFARMLLEAFLVYFFYRDDWMRRRAVWETIFESFYEHVVFLGILNVVLIMIISKMIQGYQENYDKANMEKKEIENQKIFVMSFSHEIRNLINSLLGCLQLSILEADPSSLVMARLNDAKICSEMLLHLMNNVLDSGKIKSNDLEINKAQNPIFETLKNTWALASELLNRKGLKGSIRIKNDLPLYLMFDKYRVAQMLLNLIGNAAKFTPKGSVDLSISYIEGQYIVKNSDFLPDPYDDEEGSFIKEKNLSFLDNSHSIFFTSQIIKPHSNPYRPSSGILKIKVSDTGIGISKENLPKLFKQFSQVSTGRMKQVGTGLGLYITKTLCNGMNGDIRVYSRENVGTTFIICIPTEAIAESPIGLKRSDSFQDSGVKNKNAMIVDDEFMGRDLLIQFMKRLNIKIKCEAINGDDAFQKYKESFNTSNPINLITMDINMPFSDGKTAIKKIRKFESDKRLPNAKIIIISGNCSQSEIDYCIDPNGEVKADLFLKKPITFEEIVKSIEILLR